MLDVETHWGGRRAWRDSSEMVLIPAGTFTMGCEGFYPEEGPAHRVQLEAFRVDRYPVTNAQFAEFVAATGYVTVAERQVEAIPRARGSRDVRRPGSWVFVDGVGGPGWSFVSGACWRRPFGLGSGVDDRGDHPVVHVCFEDAAAFAVWVGKELPTEAEWEYASRGGLDGATFCWGEQSRPGGELMANVWQGVFPWRNDTANGWLRTSPAGVFAPNGYGLYDMVGNVWEWTMDFWGSRHASLSSSCTVRSPQVTAPNPSLSVEHAAALRFPRRVLKGGSHLCSRDHCFRYRPASRRGERVGRTTGHVGFRCVRRVGPCAGGLGQM